MPFQRLSNNCFPITSMMQHDLTEPHFHSIIRLLGRKRTRLQIRLESEYERRIHDIKFWGYPLLCLLCLAELLVNHGILFRYLLKLKKWFNWMKLTETFWRNDSVVQMSLASNFARRLRSLRVRVAMVASKSRRLRIFFMVLALKLHVS